MSLDAGGLAEFLSLQGFSEDVVFNFEDNEIDGSCFLMMTEQHLKEAAPRLVDRIKLEQLQVDGQGTAAVCFPLFITSPSTLYRG